MCARSASMAASSSSIQCIAPRLLLPSDWQTLSKWFCLAHALHVWPYAGQIHDLLPDLAPPCWELPQLLHAFWQGFILIMVLSCSWVAVDSATFWTRFCKQYADICSPAMFEAPDILSWSRIAISNALAWLIFCSKVFSNFPLASMSACRASLAMPQMNWSLIYRLDRSWLQLGQSSAPDTAKLSNFEWTHYRFERSMKMRSSEPWDLTSVWLGPRACPSSLSGLTLKNSGYVLMMEFWMALLTHLYSWILVCVMGRLVIFVNISQSILNFQNCCEVIFELSWGIFVVGGLM